MSILKKLTHHTVHYSPLIGVLFACFLGFWLFSYDRFFQIALAIAIGISYVVWGIIHHLVHKDLTLAIAAEYVAIAFLGIVIVFSVILRA